MRIAFATDRAHASLTAEDQTAVAALARLSVAVAPAVWDDDRVGWDQFDAVVVRSCWDYHKRPAAFVGWVNCVDALGVPMLNPAAVLRWNAEKTYLRDLAAAGVRTVPTRWIESGAPDSLAAILDEQGWREAVIKPTVSLSAHNTWRVSAASLAEVTPHFRALVVQGRVMVQPFLDAVREEGEWSLVFLGGEFSHAVLKRPRPGDFRVQSEHGGTAESIVPVPAIVATAGAVLAVAPSPCVYARVDGCIVDGEFVLTELEALDASLFLSSDPRAAERFAAAIVSSLSDA